MIIYCCSSVVSRARTQAAQDTDRARSALLYDAARARLSVYTLQEDCPPGSQAGKYVAQRADAAKG